MLPLQFRPILKRARWGGRRLGSRLHKQLGTVTDFAESWEVVDHHADQSIVCSGEYSGWSLQRLISERNEELLGQHAGLKQFPLLFKFLDANDRLSVQVHPNDKQAAAWNGTPHGKTEAWIIIEAAPHSQLYAGLKQDVSQQEFAKALQSGDVESCLHTISAQAGDCVFIPAGTVHAIGEGVLLAEIQQASDITFRLYDWGKLGTDGQPRATHIVEGLDCINWSREPIAPVSPSVSATGDYGLEELVRCEKFIIQRHQSTIPFAIEQDARCRVLMMLAGAANVSCEGSRHCLQTGETLFIPAAAETLQIEPAGKVVLLDTTLPE